MSEKISRCEKEQKFDLPLFTDGDYSLVKKALKKLSFRQRKIITMRYWDSLSVSEISHILGFSWDEVSEELTKAHDILRVECLADPNFSRNPTPVAVA